MSVLAPGRPWIYYPTRGFNIVSLCFLPQKRIAETLHLQRLCKTSLAVHFSVSTVLTQSNKMKTCTPFMSMVQQRRIEATKSILVQVHSQSSCEDLYNYCKQYGEVKVMYHYQLSNNNHFVLIEYANFSDMESILKYSSYIKSNDVITVGSPLVWFRSTNKRKHRKLTEEERECFQHKVLHLEEDLGTDELQTLLLNANNVSDQLLLLHEGTKLNELGSRLRFLTARQIEVALSGLFPHIQALPFGSSVNGFGRAGCDLDLFLDLNTDLLLEEEESRFIYQAKSLISNSRNVIQKQMESIADLIQIFLPGCSGVKRILRARVPIIKYRQDLTSVDCDLSMTNMVAFYISEILFLFGSMDERVRPLVFAIRRWAQCVGLTNPIPGRWITNFSLTLLVLFFLQQPRYGNSPILPSLETMFKKAGPNDKVVTKEGINCSFLRDVTKVKTHSSSSSESLENLLLNFFVYYASFDFSSKAVSIINGKAVSKPNHAALYVVNPLERELNVSKNVSFDEVERFRIESRNAVWTLETSRDQFSKNKGHFQNSDSPPWGLLSLFLSSSKSSPNKNVFYLPAHNKISKTSNKIVSADEFDDDDPFTDIISNKKREMDQRVVERFTESKKTNTDKKIRRKVSRQKKR